jgi:hypothetical protein
VKQQQKELVFFIFLSYLIQGDGIVVILHRLWRFGCLESKVIFPESSFNSKPAAFVELLLSRVADPDPH